MNKDTTFYITTPIYYPSSKLHIGHSYTTVAADAIARFKRLTGYEVWFLTGTDEHGQKIQRQAEADGKQPQQFVDEVVEGIKELWSVLDISHNDFIRTTEDRHKEVVQKIFNQFYENGDIYKGKYEGWYCTPCESFWLERQLEEGKCPDCGREVEMVSEENYFFRLSKYADRLWEHIENNPEFIQPVSRKNEMIKNFLEPGLEDLCVSRTTFDWGIQVPFDQDHVIYVWLDALSNYITALGYLSDDDNKFQRYWPADVHLMAKEIVRFHAIYWPIFLMALDLPLPKSVFGHGWLMLNEGKMSKSKGNVVDPIVLANRYSTDAIRYYLLREIPFGADGVFTIESLVQRINYDLANDLGNLVSRTLTMIERYFDGYLPTPEVAANEDDKLKEVALQAPARMESSMNDLQISVALGELWELVRQCNRYIDQNAPWDLAKNGDENSQGRLQTVMYNLAEGIRFISVLLQPFMPKTSESIWSQLNISEAKKLQTWESIANWGGLQAGQMVKREEDLFPRLNLNKELNWSSGGDEKEKDTDSEKQQDLINIKEFNKVEMRTGKVISAEPVPKADKLLCVKVKLGEDEVKQVVAGIALSYSPEDIIGKDVIVVTNLQPTKMKGVLSEGMLLAATDEAGNLSLVTLDTDLPPGSKVT